MLNKLFKNPKNLLDALLPPKERKPNNNPVFSNSQLVDELVECFDYELEVRSVRSRMLYPMSFNILLHPDDYSIVEENLPFVLPEVVSAFYDEIKKYQNTYSNYIPTAKYWFFQISPCEREIELNEHDTLSVEQGKPQIMARLFTKDTSIDNTHVQTNVRVTVKPKNSNVFSTVNINMQALTGIDTLSKGTFKIKFDFEKRNTVLLSTEEEQNVMFEDRLATLTYEDGGQKHSFYMIDHLIEISGKDETRQGSRFMKIGSNAIINSHVQIKYIPEENIFKMAAFAKTRKNAVPVNPLSSGGDIHWVNLPHNSDIFMNDTVNVKFLVNK